MGDIIPDQSPQTIAIDLVLETTTTDQDKNTKPLSTSILTKLHAGYFRICLSLGGQALLWRTLSEHKDTTYDNSLNGFSVKFPTTTFLLLWYVALFVLIILSFIYVLRCIFHYHMVKAEFVHFVGVNYMFTPWTSWLLLLQSAPFLDPKSRLYQALWFIFVAPLLVLDVKIYGQWFTTEKRFLSTVANPTSQISVMGNLVAAWSAAEMGWKESATCFFTLGMTHYLVVFITLYQRLSGGDHLPVRLRPVYFLFVAAPSMASLAWSSISGSFDTPCRMLLFLSLFLFTSLACRPTLFKKAMKKFNIAWWAYSFPLTFLALSSVAYAQQVKGMAASGLMLILSIVSVLVFLCLMLSTALNIDMILRGNDPVLNFDYKAQ